MTKKIYDIENSKKSKRIKIDLHLDSVEYYYSTDPLTLSPQNCVNATLGHKDFGLFGKKQYHDLEMEATLKYRTLFSQVFFVSFTVLRLRF